MKNRKELVEEIRIKAIQKLKVAESAIVLTKNVNGWSTQGFGVSDVEVIGNAILLMRDGIETGAPVSKAMLGMLT